MSVRKSIPEKGGVYFITFTCARWRETNLNESKMRISFFALLLFFFSCNERQSVDITTNNKDSVGASKSIVSAEISKSNSNEINGDLKSFVGNWSAKKYFFVSKIGSLGTEQANEMLNKCLYKIEQNRIVNYVTESGYDPKGQVIDFDTSRISSISVDSLLNEDTDYNSYKSIFKQNIIGKTIRILDFGKKAELDSSNTLQGWYVSFMIDSSRNVWVDNGGGGCFLIEKK